MALMPPPYRTLGELKQDVLTELADLPGVAASLYTLPRIGRSIQSLYNRIIDLEWWPEVCQWYQWTLDGSTGTVTDVINNILRRPQDLQGVYIAGRTPPLPRLGRKQNPYTAINASGTIPVAVELGRIDGKWFRIWPLAATGTIYTYVRTTQGLLNDTDIVYLDSELLTLGAAYQLIEDDESNPGTVSRMQKSFEQRLNHVRALASNMPIALGTDRMNVVADDWITLG